MENICSGEFSPLFTNQLLRVSIAAVKVKK